MKPRRPRALAATASVAVALVCSCLNTPLDSQGAVAQPVDVRQERVKAAVAQVFDTSVLHRIEIVIAAEDARRILNRTSERVQSTFTFDGIVLKARTSTYRDGTRVGLSKVKDRS